MLLAALGLGLAVGLVIGALGGGGSILTVPLLVFALGLSAQQATSGSLVIVGVTAVVASISHARAGNTRWRTGLLLAAAGLPASVLGTRLNRLTDENVLLLIFATVMLVTAAGMLLRSAYEHDPEVANSEAPARGGATATAIRAPVAAPAARTSPAVRLVSAGVAIGFLTGFLGVGGGFVLVPVLVIGLQLPMPVAVGTSLLVIALNSGVALAARAGQGEFDWAVIAPFTATAVAGSLLGKKIATRVRADTLTRAFAVLLVLVAGYVAIRAVVALS